ncbi:SCO family protein [Catenovulum sediminis]|uniref:SCO family protein n=1 Tax=Catenovulum sediminis TaxID=1740262 RepID=A0ABV1RLN3_9ALTE|nr:SCO family protein [Catenovulum sediminis]
MKLKICALFCFIIALNACQDVADNGVKAEFPNVLLYPTAKEIQPFVLKDEEAALFDNSALAGKWTLFFLGYTFCPDICPTTLADLNRVYPQLTKVNPNVQVVLISADPQRDTHSRLKQYIEFFNADFKAVTGPHPDLLPFTRNLGLVYAMHGEGDNYLVNHSAALVLVDPNTRIRAMIKPDFTSQPPSINFQQIAEVLTYLQ